MEVKQGYKETEIGIIPEDWEVKSIKEIAPLQRGFDLPNRELTAGIYPVVYSNGIVNYHNKFQAKSPGIVTGRSGTIGKVTFIEENYWPHNTSLWVTNFNDNDPKYIYYLFLKIKFERFASGSGVPTLNRNDVHDFRISIPTKAEQTAIATALSDTDALIESLEKLIAKKRLIKQGAMQELLKAKEGWKVKRLGESADIYRGGSPRPIESFLTTNPNGINWIKIGDVGKGAKYIETTEEKIIHEGISRSRFVYEGDFLLSNSMSFGRPYILKTKGCIHDGWLVIQNYQNHFDREFLYYVLGSESVLIQYKAMASGSSVLNLNKEIVKNVLLNCPKSIEEQTRIATILSDMDKEIEALEAKLDKYRKIKVGMMQQLLTGKIRLI